MSDGVTNIGPYRLVRLINAGGEGSVYEARDLRLGRRVAAKLLPLPDDAEPLVRQTRALAAVHHRSIVQIFDIVESSSHLVLIMEYVPGTDLGDMQRTVDLDVATVIQLGIELCGAVAALHMAGFVHRDLKPGNVLMDEYGAVKLTDFGLARPIAPPDRSEYSAADGSGSYYAMSPEQARGEPLDQRTDIFAIGLILYRCLAGEHPFPWRGRAEEFLHRLERTRHVPLTALRPDVPAALSQLVDRALDKDSRARPYTASELRHQLVGVNHQLTGGGSAGLAELVVRNRREGERHPLMSRSPRGNFRRLRSHLMSTEDWAPWSFEQGGLYRVMGYSGIGLLLFMGFIQLSLVWFDRPPQSVRVLPGIVVSESGVKVPAGVRLAEVVAGQLQRLPGIRVAEGYSDNRLMSRLRCNDRLCQLQLVLDRGGQLHFTHLQLMPDTDPENWRDQIYAGLKNL